MTLNHQCSDARQPRSAIFPKLDYVRPGGGAELQEGVANTRDAVCERKYSIVVGGH